MSNAIRVMICDDSRLALMKLKKVFASIDCEVIEAHQDGPSVIAAYKESAERVDLVSLDLVMPGMDGLEVLAELKAFDPDVKVLILSSIVQPEIEEKANELGAAGVLEKPYDAEKIREAIDLALKGDS